MSLYRSKPEEAGACIRVWEALGTRCRTVQRVPPSHPGPPQRYSSVWSCWDTRAGRRTTQARQSLNQTLATPPESAQPIAGSAPFPPGGADG